MRANQSNKDAFTEMVESTSVEGDTRDRTEYRITGNGRQLLTLLAEEK